MNEKQRLQEIINSNLEAANNGSGSAMMQCIAAQADLDRIAQAELEENQKVNICSALDVIFATHGDSLNQNLKPVVSR